MKLLTNKKYICYTTYAIGMQRFGDAEELCVLSALFFAHFLIGRCMGVKDIRFLLESNPVIPAVRQDKFHVAIESPCDVIFCLGESILTVKEHIKLAHSKGKRMLVHIDLADGIGKDAAGVKFLAYIGCDGIISTKPQMIKFAKKEGLFTVQRFFTLDTQGLESISELLSSSTPSMIEIMPGVITKTISRFAHGTIPVIAGGLIETKEEITAALRNGAVAVSTGKESLWYI